MKNKQLSRGMIAWIMIGMAIVLLVVSHFLPLGDNLKMIIFDYGGDTYPFSIQNIMWIVFFIGFGELWYRVQLTSALGDELGNKLLPEDDHAVLTPKDLGEYFRKVKDKNDSGLAGLIKSLIMQFQTSHSIEQTHSMLNSQIELKNSLMDVRYSFIRYIVWLIPTLGFIGTVIGIALALAYAGDPSTDPSAPEFLSVLTQKLGVAFYTTLVALVMSGILVFVMHIVQAKEEEQILKEGKYCLDNFINRLYVDRSK